MSIKEHGILQPLIARK
ncbi:hypothetical protein ACT4UL_15840, partial [Bacillus sp. HC-TM]